LARCEGVREVVGDGHWFETGFPRNSGGLSESGLPDGLFSNQKSIFGKTWEGLAMEDVGIFYGDLVHLTVFCYILLTFGKPSSW
jgi:hypothetical protein